MQVIEKAPASVYQTRVEAGVETSGALISARNDNTMREKTQVVIAQLLPRGSKNAVSTKELMRLTGYRTARALQKQIEAERAQGALILSASTGGYYLPAPGADGREEIVRYERTLHARAVNTLRTLKAARRARRVIDGQEVLPDG